MNHIKAIVFDMDGVILDTETMVDKSWIIAAKEFNLPQIQDAMVSVSKITPSISKTIALI